MKRPRFRLWWLIPLACILVPPLLWMLVLLIIPTDWARLRIERAVSQATGRTVHLESLRIGVLGGVRLTNLEIGAPRSVRDPWLKLADASVNVTLLQLLFGQAEPTEARVEGITLRVLRRADGTLELADLIPAAPADPNAPSNSGEHRCALGGLDVRIENAHVLVIDEPSQTRLEFSDVEGNATWQNRQAIIHELRGTLNGGPFELTAQLDGATAPLAFEGQIRARGVELNEGMNALGYLVPVVAGTSDKVEDKVDGRIDVNLYLRGQGLTSSAIETSLIGHGAVSLDPVRLDGSKMLAEMANLVDLPASGRVGSVKTDFEIKQGRISTENLTVNVAKVPIVLAGWTDFDGRVDYRLKSDSLTDRLPGKARNLLSELAIDPNIVADLRVQGTLDALVVTMDGVRLNQAGGGSEPSRRVDDRKRLRELGKRLRDRVLR